MIPILALPSDTTIITADDDLPEDEGVCPFFEGCCVGRIAKDGTLRPRVSIDLSDLNIIHLSTIEGPLALLPRVVEWIDPHIKALVDGKIVPLPS